MAETQQSRMTHLDDLVCLDCESWPCACDETFPDEMYDPNDFQDNFFTRSN